MVAVLITGFFCGESCQVLCTEQVTGNPGFSHCVADTGSLCPSSLFLVISIHLTLGGVKPKQVLHVIPKKAGETGHSPCSPFPGEGNASW